MVEHNLTDQVQNLYDATVYDQDGDKIGGVAQVYLDDHTGQPSWATVKTGFFGTKETFVPLDDASISGEEIRVPYTKSFVKDAPNMDADTHLDEAEEAELYRYYSKSYDDGVAGEHHEGVVGRVRDDVDHDADRARAHVDHDADRVRADVDHDVDRARHDVDHDIDRARHDVDHEVDRAESVVRHEEELHVGKERVATGRMRLRKHVVTEQKTVTVPVQREEYTLEREPIAEGDHGQRGAGHGEVGEEEISVTTYEERPVVEKEVVAKERIGLGKETVTEEREVTADVAREEVTLDQDGVEGVRGDRDARRDHDGNPLT